MMKARPRGYEREQQWRKEKSGVKKGAGKK